MSGQASADFLNEVIAKCSRGPVRLFKNVVGMGYIGKVVHREPGLITLAHPRVLHAGLAVGSPDLVGFKVVTITPEMVGAKIAVFAGIEAKLGEDRERKEQKAFRAFLTSAGAIAGVAGTIEDAQAILSAAPR
jgi:hypothetical protein